MIVCAYLIFDNAFPPLLPKSLMIEFMIITIIGVLLFFSFEEKRWNEFKAPIKAVLRDENKWLIRWAFLIFIPALFAFTVYNAIKPSFESPVELRQVHPAPPSSVRVFNKSFNLTSLENPIRTEVLAKGHTEAANEIYQAAVQAGSEVYFKNCFFCHGDLLDGNGHFADGFNPIPANFQDVGTIAQLQEAFLFWRIATGGPGLPKEGTPWNSAMPVWHEILKEDEIWQVITFLYDYVGQVPRIWDPKVSKAVTSMKDKIQSQRAKMTGQEIYQFRCAICHGEEGDGDSVAAELLYPKPRDFTLGMFKYKTSPSEKLVLDEDLFNTIKYGLKGTSMPAWETLLTDEQIKSLIPVIKRFDISASWEPEEADEDEDFDEEGHYIKDDFVRITDKEPIEDQIAYSEESIAQGKIAFEKTCRQCHGYAGRGNITSGKRLADDWGNRLWPRDLTQPWTWRVSHVSGNDEKSRNETIRKIYARLSIGIPGTPMPAHRSTTDDPDPVSLADRWHIANYVYSLGENDIPPGENTVIKGVNVTMLPTTVDDDAWSNAPATTLRLVPNIIKGERLFTPLSEAITARVLYNKDEIAFLLEMSDRTDSRPGDIVSDGIQDEDIEMQSDAFAIQFPKAESFETTPIVRKPLYRHGDAANPTTIWYWNAGNLDLMDEIYPKSMIFNAKGPEKRLEYRSNDKTLVATGKWEQGHWRVLMKRPRDGSNSGDVSFTEGQFIPISFANWDGSNGEVGSKHTLTSWYWLLLPPKTDYNRLYGMPLGVGFLTFLLGIVLVRNQRRKTA
ncbi:c-type cytochrome [Candidatus Marithioploca araucensis]|uniref:C-type cytochrome n=1 Tax=Candidatus Marithioploca araucensis TaxID=70273 RepID=A0ABT7VQ54_9GAMM|nr:c-type cytochrome [Candidatus Marithioploca araucensis]